MVGNSLSLESRKRKHARFGLRADSAAQIVVLFVRGIILIMLSFAVCLVRVQLDYTISKYRNQYERANKPIYKNEKYFLFKLFL